MRAGDDQAGILECLAKDGEVVPRRLGACGWWDTGGSLMHPKERQPNEPPWHWNSASRAYDVNPAARRCKVFDRRSSRNLPHARSLIARRARVGVTTTELPTPPCRAVPIEGHFS
jgi:hypothetical protein